MADTATAVETAVSAAFEAPTESAPPVAVRRDEVREQILQQEWKDDDALREERLAAEQPEAPAAPDGVASEPAPSASPDVSDADPTGEPPAASVITDASGRIVVRAPDGKFAAAPEVKLEFAIGEKTYLKSPAELVRMARDGVAGQQYYQEVQQYRQQVPALVQQYEAMQQELEAQRALSLEMLHDEAAYLRRRDEWSQLNTPEARLARIEQERQEELQQRLQTEQQSRAQQEQARQQQLVATYYLEELKPIQDELLDQYPEVPLEAKMGRMAIDTLPMMEHGVIPPNRLPEYKAYLAGPFRQWVQSEAAKIRGMTEAQQQQLQHAQRQAQQQAQRAVQTVGRQLAPTGRAGVDTPPPAPKPRNREEAKAMIINRPWQDG